MSAKRDYSLTQHALADRQISTVDNDVLLARVKAALHRALP